MESFRTFWTWAYIIGIGSFYVMVLVVIPLGFRDLIKLFLSLGGPDDHHETHE